MQQTSDTRVSGRLFPLHLTAFEDYMLWDDSSSFPMTFVVQFELKGKVDRAALEQALPKALARHPLLTATVDKAKGNRDCWVAGAAAAIGLTWTGLDAPIDLGSGEAIDLKCHPGLRVWVQADDERAVLTTQFHHSTCDGIGSYQFLGDWLWFYAQAIGEPAEEPMPDVDVKVLKQRGRATYNPELFREANGAFRSERVELKRLLFKRIEPLAAPRHSLATASSRRLEFPGIVEFELDKDRYKDLRHVAEHRGQSVNELLIDRLFQTMVKWNERQGTKSDGNWCIMMPMDLREPNEPIQSAANVVTYAMIRRSSSEIRAEDELVESLRLEMVHLKHQRHRSSFMNILAGLTNYAKWFKRLVIRRKCMASAILSNTGDPTKRFTVNFPRVGGLVRCGNLLITDVRGVPPMRPKTRVTISIFTYRRVLKICMRCDPQRFSKAETQQLLDLYAAQVDHLLNAKPEPDVAVQTPALV